MKAASVMEAAFFVNTAWEDCFVLTNAIIKFPSC
jgi:hypothetical protein